MTALNGMDDPASGGARAFVARLQSPLVFAAILLGILQLYPFARVDLLTADNVLGQY